MTENEKRIFSLMMEDVKGFSLKPIGKIAALLDISKTTLMRFARSSGFAGYSDFKKALQEEELLDTLPAQKIKSIIENDSFISAENIRQMEIDNINNTFDAIMEQDLTRFVENIVKASCIYTMGWGPSHYIADIFTMRMRLMGLTSNSLKRENTTLADEAERVTASDFLIVFEMPPYVHEVLSAVQVAKKNKAYVIVVTDKPQCPLMEHADMFFHCSTKTPLFGNSMTSLLFWVNLVSSQMMFRLKNNVMEKLEKQQELFKDPRYYIQ